MPIVGVDLLWRVEVQPPGWHTWATSAGRRLRQTLEADPDVVCVPKVTSFLERLMLRSIPPTVTIELVADSPGAAHRCAERVVARSLAAIGHAGPAIP